LNYNAERSVVVFDEAHNLGSVCTETSSVDITETQATRFKHFIASLIAKIHALTTVKKCTEGSKRL